MVAPRQRGRARRSSAGAGSATVRGAGLGGLCNPVGGRAETESEPTCGLEDLAGRLRRRRGSRETGESPRGRREETSEASRLGRNGLGWQARQQAANIFWWAPLMPRPLDCRPLSSPQTGPSKARAPTGGIYSPASSRAANPACGWWWRHGAGVDASKEGLHNPTQAENSARLRTKYPTPVNTPHSAEHNCKPHR
ncbi:hypothetical protein NDU88_004158 [Pleurodeles waltl]|uniref:Uncharacterized protein n=1 Tax=Pleurodeles waltl TaxID=8319 RepID=A0AAV7M7D7_PLEWA|nr:hypothetical protein NDU88_004158 [Pleurodeles waltl]